MQPQCAFAPAAPILVASAFLSTSTCPPAKSRPGVAQPPRKRVSPVFPIAPRPRSAPSAPQCALSRRLAQTSSGPAGAPSPLHIIISGAPASGKGTQCAQIVSNFKIPHISTGDMLRAAVAAKSPLGIEAKEYMDAGALVPDELVIAMLKARIAEEDCVTSGWLLDGFPRTETQARALDEAGVKPDAVIVLDVKDDVLVERVVGRRLDPETGEIYHVSFRPPPEGEVAERCVQRSDDTEEKARARLETFHKNEAAIAAHYSDILVRVDGERAKEVVFGDLRGVIENAMGKSDDDGGSGTGGPGSAGGAASVAGGAIAGAAGASESVKGIPVAEFVRRAEEAYEKGSLSTEDVNWSGQAGAETAEADGTASYADILRRPDLALGDALGLLLFAYIGHRAHHTGGGNEFLEVLGVASWFLIAWFAVAPRLGAFTRKSTQNAVQAVKYAVGPVAVSTGTALAMRAVYVEHLPPKPFVVVSFAATATILTAWRLSYTLIRGPETDEVRRGGIFDGLNMVTTLFRRW